MDHIDNRNQRPTPIRVMMSPWLGYGHISPYLQLAKKLSTRGGFKIHICSTPITLTSIHNKITSHDKKSITLVPLTLPNLPNLPLNLQTTNGLPPHLMATLIEAFATSAGDFSTIMADLKPDLLIYDILQPWAPLVAKRHRVPAVHFITCSATLVSFMLHHFITPETEFPFSKIHYREYEGGDRHEKGMLKEKKELFEEIRSSNDVVLIKGFREIEGKYIDYATCLSGRRFVPVGPLVVVDQTMDYQYQINIVSSWLDNKEKKSTVFVSFGSEYYLSKEDINGISHGLELSGVNFIWVVRFPKAGSCNNNYSMNNLEETLPKGFIKRVGDKGLVLEGWAPQREILGHPSVGGFVSHCGWNSVMESMHWGVPIIAVPMQIDQPLNARLVGEVGVGVEVLRDTEDKRVDGEALARVIKKVVIEDGGECVRQKALHMRKKMELKGDEEIDHVVNQLLAVCNKYSTN